MKWGILGVNWIADYLATSMRRIPGVEIVAAASRTASKTAEFAKRHGVPRQYSSCGELAQDPDVEAVYISTPHSFHFEHSMICLKAGKHVLCEKPFTVTRAKGEELFNEAERRGLFIMEAMWTRYLPSVAKMREAVTMGAIGQVMSIDLCSGGGIGEQDPAGRMLNPALAGGATLDIGCYALTVAQILAGRHESLCSRVIIGETGVDVRAATCVKYESGALATIITAFDANVEFKHVNRVCGTSGVLTFDGLWSPTSFTLQRHGDENERGFIFRNDMRAYEYELEAFEDCVRKGLKEPENGKREDTLEILGMMEEILGKQA
ncbi:MAG: Gfo/Idh/MocA family oxidoreductase [Defluviitaleaceae bacterium]|nr:Gfo/Idh/MocA family oxidoreductase [Defluviitaleaceae bacterium]